MEYKQTALYSHFNSQKTYENFLNILNELKEKILKSLDGIITKDEEKLNNLIIDLKESFETVTENLREIKFYEEEYYDFFSIKRMAFYILDNKELFEQLPSIRTLINSFYKLIQKKTASNNENYLEEHKHFNSELVAYEQFFYTKICKPSENYDEKTLSKITNALIKL